MAKTQHLDLAGPAGRLEAILMLPDGQPIAAGVVCHAHPLHGGIMQFKTVFRAAKALQKEGVAALRFNFRGVGRSEGEHGEGRGEQDDLRAALDEMERRHPGLPLIAGGFSFGSLVALQVGMREPRVRAIFALGLPLSRLEDPSFLERSDKPRLFVQGEHDEFGSAEELARLVERWGPPARMVTVRGSDHFFVEHLSQVQDAVGDWVAARHWEGS